MEILGNRILVLRKPKLEETLSGIIIPIAAQEQRFVGTIKKIGTTVNPFLQGKDIVFDPSCGTDFEHNGENHIIMFTPDIRAIINN